VFSDTEVKVTVDTGWQGSRCIQETPAESQGYLHTCQWPPPPLSWLGTGIGNNLYTTSNHSNTLQSPVTVIEKLLPMAELRPTLPHTHSPDLTYKPQHTTLTVISTAHTTLPTQHNKTPFPFIYTHETHTSKTSSTLHHTGTLRTVSCTALPHSSTTSQHESRVLHFHTRAQHPNTSLVYCTSTLSSTTSHTSLVYCTSTRAPHPNTSLVYCTSTLEHHIPTRVSCTALPHSSTTSQHEQPLLNIISVD
jgi:hypothetical protein